LDDNAVPGSQGWVESKIVEEDCLRATDFVKLD
jgi:hypothetical protein